MERGQPGVFGAVLRRHRVALGLTQEALAERAGMSARTIADLERGVNRTPRRDTVPLLADALGLAAAERFMVHCRGSYRVTMLLLHEVGAATS
jgi:transcriptional regulator with XRE-family HTH domain